MARSPRGGRRRRALAAVVAVVWTGGLACDSRAQTRWAATRAPVESGIWISRGEIRELPMSGPAWEALVEAARTPVRRPDLSDQNDPSNVRVLAKALVFARTGDRSHAEEVAEACKRIRGTERGATSLAISRELMAYVIAADLVELPPEERLAFAVWLREIRDRDFRGRTIRSTHEDRPNNWGTHAGATRLAIAAYLGDRDEIERAAFVFRGWTGEETGWQAFEFGETWWQAGGPRLFAVNPAKAVRKGHPIGGVLPDDQRRGGPFEWPPPHENYVYEALQGAVAQAVLLERLGYDAWSWGDRALLRAFEWLYVEARYPAEGDDTWLPPIVNRAYGADFPTTIPSKPGKAVGFGDWTHARPSPKASSEASAPRRAESESRLGESDLR